MTPALYGWTFGSFSLFGNDCPKFLTEKELPPTGYPRSFIWRHPKTNLEFSLLKAFALPVGHDPLPRTINMNACIQGSTMNSDWLQPL